MGSDKELYYDDLVVLNDDSSKKCSVGLEIEENPLTPVFSNLNAVDGEKLEGDVEDSDVDSSSDGNLNDPPQEESVNVNLLIHPNVSKKDQDAHANTYIENVPDNEITLCETNIAVSDSLNVSCVDTIKVGTVLNYDLHDLNDYERDPKMKLPDNVSSRSAVSLPLKNAPERDNEKNKKKDIPMPLSEEDKMNVKYEDSEYSEKDIDRARDELSGPKRKVPKNALAYYGKVTACKRAKFKGSKLIRKKAQDTEKMDTDIVLPNVSQFHVPRPKNETTEERKIRKGNIKTAKRQKRVVNKKIKNLYKKLSK